MALPLVQLKSKRKIVRTEIKLGHDSYKGRSMIGGSSEPALRISFEDYSSSFPLRQTQPHLSLYLCSIAIPMLKCPQCHPADSSSCGCMGDFFTSHYYQALFLKSVWTVDEIKAKNHLWSHCLLLLIHYNKKRKNPSNKNCIFLVHSSSSPQVNSLTLSPFGIPSHPILPMFLSLLDIHF